MNEDPYDARFRKIEPSDESQYDKLLDADADVKAHIG